MRSTLVFLILVALSGLFVTIQVTRKPTAHRSSLAPAPAKKTPPEAKAAAKGSATKKAAAPVAAKKKPAPAKPLPPRMNRPLRVASLGWELIAPGVVANKGAEPTKASAFAKERLEVHLTAFTKLDELEAALARGGADASGADVAILPLPELCASYERLRALSPQVFLVLGWSRGRDGLLAAREDALQRPPRAGRVELAAERGSSPAFLALFLLDAAGVPVKRVSLVDPSTLLGRAPAPTSAARRTPAFAALERPLPASAKPGELKFVATTADARRLIPIVAVAPAGLLASHGEALGAWGQVWLDGVTELERDVPAAARQVSALKQAPAAIDLLGRLGGIEAASLAENARLLGLSGRDPVTLEELFRRSWAIWRANGLLTSPPPERAPVQGEAVAAMVRSYPTTVEAPLPGPSKPPRADGHASPRSPGAALFSHAPAVRKPADALATLAFLAAAFDRSPLKVSWRESLAQARLLVRSASERFDLPRPERLQPAAHREGPPLSIEVSTP